MGIRTFALATVALSSLYLFSPTEASATQRTRRGGYYVSYGRGRGYYRPYSRGYYYGGYGGRYARPGFYFGYRSGGYFNGGYGYGYYPQPYYYPSQTFVAPYPAYYGNPYCRR